jgi:hypothetical protein
VDLNHFYYHHQLLQIRAERTASGVTQRDCEVSASHLAGRIGMQRSLGAGAAPEAFAVVHGASVPAPLRHQQGYTS